MTAQCKYAQKIICTLISTLLIIKSSFKTRNNGNICRLHLPANRALPSMTVENLNPRGGDAILRSKILHNTHEHKRKGGGRQFEKYRSSSQYNIENKILIFLI